MHKNAVISDCKKYRYWLERRFDRRFDPQVFVMLNPSTADSEIDDPTIRRCIDFAKREGASGIVVVNLFAFRATEPKELDTAVDKHGSENVRYIGEALMMSAVAKRPAICAWGANHHAVSEVAQLKRRAKDIGTSLSCLGVTKSGAPKHPLYLAKTVPIQDYSS